MPCLRLFDRLLPALPLLLVALLAHAPPAWAEVEEIAIAASRQDRTGSGEAWFFDVEVSGSDLISASVTIPGAQGRTEMLSGDAFDLQYEDPLLPPGFATYEELIARNPPGSYTVVVMDSQGTKTVALDFAPTKPVDSSNGETFVRMSFPSGGDTLGCGTPDFNYTTSCTNCTDYLVELFDVPTDGSVVDAFVFGDGTGIPSPVPFDSLMEDGGGSPGPLADSSYEVEIGIGFFDEQPGVGFDSGPTDPFDYFQESSLLARAAFTVVNQPQDLEEIFIGAFREASSGPVAWTFEIETVGQNLCSVAVDWPASAPRRVYLERDFSDLGFQEDPFDTFALLQTPNPPGNYGFTINGTQTTSVFWNPTQPVGAGGEPSLSITSPADGSSNVSSTPDASYSLDCSNCVDFLAEYFPLFPAFSCGFETSGQPFPEPVLFSSMVQDGSQSPCPPLANGEWEAEVIAGFLSSATGFLAPSGDDFEYVEEASVAALSEFVVPEPGASLLGGLALAAVALLARGRSGRTASSARRP